MIADAGLRQAILVGLLSSQATLFAAHPAPEAPQAPASVAVLGDNLATGAATSPQLMYDADSLWDLFKKTNLSAPPVPAEIAAFTKQHDLTAPITLWMSEREYAGSFDWVFKHFLAGFSKVYLNTEEYSWGYLTAKALGVASENIFLGGENGARVDALPLQIERLLQVREGELPEKIFILFSYNDLCANHPQFITTANAYYFSLLHGLEYLMRHGRAPAGGSEIYVLGPLGITQLLTKSSITQKQLRAHGEETTCEELRQRSYQPNSALTEVRHMESLYFQHLLPPNPARFCPTLMAQRFIAQNELGFFSNLNKAARARKIDSIVTDMISSLAGRIRQFRQKSTDAVRDAQAWAHKENKGEAFRLHYVEASEALEFEGNDIADDCFHLNWKGQLKIAEGLLSYIKGQET